MPAFLYVANKAGMDGIDKDKVHKIVNDASKDSDYYRKQMEKTLKNEAKVVEIKKKIENFMKDKGIVEQTKKLIEKKIQGFEKERNLNRWWVQFDLDMFYVACEIRDNPSLKDKPVAAGGIGMICTANYVARKFGVRSAMPGFIGKRLCPELILIPLNFEKYSKTADKFKEVIDQYDPNPESAGLDEANLDITNYLLENNITKEEDIEKLFYDVRMKINEATGITVSCGMAPNKMLAKMCSEINKPNGQFLLKQDREEILKFVGKLPVRKIPGIGNCMEQMLNGMDIKTCQDIIDRALDLHIGFTENASDFLLRSAMGIARCYHELPEDRKSISISRTFQALSKQEDMENKIRELAVSLSEDLKAYKKLTKQLTLTLKTFEFNVTNRVSNLEKFINDPDTIAITCIKILKEQWPVKPMRLIGIRAAELISEFQLHSGLDKYLKPKLSVPSTSSDTSNPKILIHADPDDNYDKESNDQFFIDENSPRPSTDGHLSSDKEDRVESSLMSTFDEKFKSKFVEKSGNSVFGTNEKSKTSIIDEKSSTTEDKFKSEGAMSNTMQSHASDSMLSSKLILVNEVICPVCNMKFESTVNKTRINNHVEKCLLKSTSVESTTGTEGVTTNNTNSTNSKGSAGKRSAGKRKGPEMDAPKNSKKLKPNTDTLKKPNYDVAYRGKQ
jgi:nucleotidyltransferase/DNA polymerase involved in DNA repair